MDKILVVRSERCMACKTCVLECAAAHSEEKTLESAVNAEEIRFPRIILEYEESETFPIHCRHCKDAPCIAVCPTQAMSRPNEESPVILNRDKCIGCNACIIVCPFGVIKRDSDGKTLTKCDLCYERLEEGKDPACAAGCPTGAIKYVEVSELNLEERKESIRKYKVSLQKG